MTQQENPKDKPEETPPVPDPSPPEASKPEPKRRKSKKTASPPRQQSPWERASSKLPKTISRALKSQANDNQGPEQLDYQELRGRLPAAIVEQVDAIVMNGVDEAPDAPEPRWCVCEVPEGDFPKVRVFMKLESMLRHLTTLDGQEIAVWLFYGLPMRLTVPLGDNKDRYVYMPGDVEAKLIPKSDREPLTTVDAGLLDGAEWQMDGWLGDPALTEGVAEEYFTGNKLKSPADEDDEFDDNGEFDDDDDVETSP